MTPGEHPAATRPIKQGTANAHSMNAEPAAGSFLEGVVDRMGDLLGDKAGQAAFQFAAHSEGKRIASGYASEPVGRLLERLDAVLGHRTELLEEAPSSVHLKVSGSRLLDADRAILEIIVLGMLEGAFSTLRGARHRAKVTKRTSEGILIEVSVDDD